MKKLILIIFLIISQVWIVSLYAQISRLNFYVNIIDQEHFENEVVICYNHYTENHLVGKHQFDIAFDVNNKPILYFYHFRTDNSYCYYTTSYGELDVATMEEGSPVTIQLNNSTNDLSQIIVTAEIRVELAGDVKMDFPSYLCEGDNISLSDNVLSFKYMENLYYYQNLKEVQQPEIFISDDPNNNWHSITKDDFTYDKYKDYITKNFPNVDVFAQQLYIKMRFADIESYPTQLPLYLHKYNFNDEAKDALYFADDKLHVKLDANEQLSLFSIFSPSTSKNFTQKDIRNEDGNEIIGLNNGFLDFQGKKYLGLYRLIFGSISKDIEENTCKVVRYMYVPDVEYKKVNNGEMAFWYEGEHRDAITLQYKYPNGYDGLSVGEEEKFIPFSPTNVNIYHSLLSDNDPTKVANDCSISGPQIIPFPEGVIPENRGFFITIPGPTDNAEQPTYSCNIVQYAVNTTSETNLSWIAINFPDNFVPVTLKIDNKLEAYPNIDATLNDITPPVCNGSDMSVKISDIKDGLGGDYTFAVVNGYDLDPKPKVENGIWSVSIKKNEIESGSSLETISLSIFDAKVPPEDKFGRDARSKSFSFTVKRPQKLEITEVSSTNLRCFQDKSGSIEITKVNRSYEDEPVLYHWYISPNINQEIKEIDSNPKIEGLSRNDYVVKITNNECVFTSDIIRIDEPPQLIIGNPTVTDAMCYGYHDGAITTETTGGTPYKDEADKPYYHYHWKQDKNSTSQPWDNDRTTADISDLPAGKYQLTVWDANYCEATTDWITVSHPIELINSLTSSYTICKGSELAIDDGNQNPGNFNCYEWRLPNNTTRQGREITIKPDMPQGKYVLVSKNDNCFTTNTTEITFADNNLPIRFLVPTESFFDDTLVIAEDSEIDDDYTWRYAYNTEMFSDITDKVVNPNANLTFLHIDRSGNDTITMYADNGFCKASLSKEVTVSPHFRSEDYDYTVDAAGIFSRLQIGPNPNNGEFTLFANLTEDSPLTISLYDVMRSRKIPIDFSKYKTPASHYQIPFQGLGLHSGAYTLLVSANGETKQIKFVVE